MKTMKNIIGTILVAIVAVSCSKQNAGEKGSVNFRLGNLSDISIEDVTKSSLADHTVPPEAGDFTIRIIDESKVTVWEGLLSNWSPENKIFVGNYNIKASYGVEGEEGVDRPYIAGDRDFTVNSAQLSVVDLTVSLQNAIIKMECTQQFKDYYSDCEFTLVTGSNNKFTLVENQTLFIEAFRFTISGKMKNPQGKDVSFSKEYSSEILPSKCYTIKLDAANIGSNTITINFNNELETIDLGNIELND